MISFVAAKGNSVRVPRKNMRPFGGKPLVHRILQTLSDADEISGIVLDSDSAEILESVAASFPDITLIERPEELRGDAVPMNRLIENCFTVTGADELLQTHATNPLLTATTIDAAVERFRNRGSATSLMSVTPIRARLYDADLGAINHDPAELIPTQDLDVIYEENSNIYIFEKGAFLASGHRVTADCVPFEMDPLEATDIDNEHDFVLAELLDRYWDRSSIGGAAHS